ncbi:unnamed protein product [Hymenolepis diminuta]|uniref:Uncharacterized protein n=1 Tax=Hymenolepis diminuta TaxID=6216 RepID=A0A0R3SL21_HYMDI|nr:unnamed protein product [Hymenolepis diminuta]
MINDCSTHSGIEIIFLDKHNKKSDAALSKKTEEKKQRDCRRKKSVEVESKITGVVTPLKLEEWNRQGHEDHPRVSELYTPSEFE